MAASIPPLMLAEAMRLTGTQSAAFLLMEFGVTDLSRRPFAPRQRGGGGVGGGAVTGFYHHLQREAGF